MSKATADPFDAAPATQSDQAASAAAIPPQAEPRQRTVAGKRKGTLQRVSIAPDKTTTGRKTRARRTGAKVVAGKRPYVRRTPATIAGTTAGNQGALLSSLLSQNGFTDGAKLVVTEGRKTLSLPLGLFTGK